MQARALVAIALTQPIQPSQRARLPRAWRRGTAAVLLVGSALWSRGAAAQVYTGPVISRAVDQSLDIMKDHVTFLTLQDRRDAALAYFSFTHRFAPLRIALNDGTTTANVAHRVTFMEGVGYGSISKFAAFVGAWNDLVGIGPSSGDRLSFQGIAFGGLGLYGMQGTYARFVGQRLSGLDMYGNFLAPGAAGKSSFYDGAGATDYSMRSRDVFTLSHETGASLIALRSQLPSKKTIFSDIRGQFQPLKDWVKQWVGKRVGLPMVAFQKLRDNMREPPKPKAFEGPTRPETPTYEFEFGGDDLLGIGLRVHSTTEISPKLRFARAEAGFYHDIGEGMGALTVAARSFAFNRGGKIEASVDAFARIAILPVGEEHVGFPIHASVSYSFNSPDSATFLPIPNAHVFGYQLIIGLPDIARPLVPIIRPKEPEKPPEPAGARGTAAKPAPGARP